MFRCVVFSERKESERGTEDFSALLVCFWYCVGTFARRRKFGPYPLISETMNLEDKGWPGWTKNSSRPSAPQRSSNTPATVNWNGLSAATKIANSKPVTGPLSKWGVQTARRPNKAKVKDMNRPFSRGTALTARSASAGEHENPTSLTSKLRHNAGGGDVVGTEQEVHTV